MDENHQDKTGNEQIATEVKLWLPPLSPKEQEKVDHLRKKQGKASNGWIGLSGRTLWDWLNLLGVIAIPFVIAAGTLLLTQQQAALSDAANRQQHQIDIQIAEDQQRETTLKICIDDMKDLLLNKNLRASKPKDEVRVVARAEVLSTLRQLDGERKGTLMKFLYEAGLIISIENDVVIDLGDADLKGAHLSGAYLTSIHLNGAHLSGADLNNADLIRADLNNADLIHAHLTDADLTGAHLNNAHLSGADLIGAHLSGADLNNADLIHAHLTDAYLTGAHLNNAHLSGADLTDAGLSSADLSSADLSSADLTDAGLSSADLSSADLNNANLSGADLRSALVTKEQLAEAKSLKDTTMPDGSRYP